MRHVKLGVEKYFGIDLAESLIESNQKRYENPSRKFYSIDIMNEPLPKTDAIFCRDCLVHFSFDDIRRTIRNFKRTNTRYLLTAHFTRSNPNSVISTGEWRTLNFEQAPFYFPKPLVLINEKCTEAQGRYNDKSIALWLLKDLKV
ncbi:MAG: class I SAM-dependent methyltransferase [Methylococcaceae bacterium]|nr:class I SAM-dependent methyltransferase [Methylococcaceae bacterium]